MPPDWIHDAAGAEAWAFLQTTQMSPEVPSVVTDCHGIVDMLIGGVQNATGDKRVLGRLWGMVGHNLDGDFSMAARRTVWMPSHGPRSSIGIVMKSDGSTLTDIEWRANRLVDVLAKSAASGARAEPRVLRMTEGAAEMVRFAGARLGLVTHAANHCPGTVTSSDGTTKRCMRRDAMAPRFYRARSDIGVPRGPKTSAALEATPAAAARHPSPAPALAAGLLCVAATRGGRGERWAGHRGD